jgi:hypothetical protein
MQKMNLAAVLAFVTVLLASCAKEGPNGPTGPAGPVYYGNITGHVSLYDKYGSKIFANLNRVNLYLSNTSIATYPDTTGYYFFDNEPTAEYSITAVDSAFAPTVINNINFVSGVLNQDIKLSIIPDSFVTAFTATKTAGADSLVITVTPDSRFRNCIVFVNDLTASNIAYLLSYKVAVPGGATTATLFVPQQDLLNAGFLSGALVFYAAYSYVVNDASVYENPSTGAYIYNAVYPTPLTDTTRVP